jgi:hypothetical protein
VVGAGTPGAIPYAVGAELTFLADNGRARFRRTMASPIRRLASGIGPHRVRVGALLADGSLWRVLTDGKVVDTARVYAPSTVRALRVGPPGIGVQVGATVEIDRPGALLVVALPPGALMVDLTASAVLLERAGSLLLVPLSGASATVLVKGSRAQPVQGQIESNGLAWSRGSRLFFRA